MYSVSVGWNVLCMSVKSTCSIVLFRSMVSLFPVGMIYPLLKVGYWYPLLLNFCLFFPSELLIFAFLKKILFFKDFICLFLEREERKEKERNINVWLPLMHPLLGTWPTTQACALTGNQTSNPLARRPALNLLSHTSQGNVCF